VEKNVWGSVVAKGLLVPYFLLRGNNWARWLAPAWMAFRRNHLLRLVENVRCLF
jgi:hypothetical protein